MGRLRRAQGTCVVVAMLLSVVLIPVPRVAGATTDFTVTMSPPRIMIPEGYWADSLLTVTSVNGMTGTAQIATSVGGTTGLFGAGFSTGMTLPADGIVSKIIMLTPGPSTGNFTLPITVTIGSVSHTLDVPIAIYPVSSPDLITRLWGSYSILQAWNTTVQDQQMVTSLGGFSRTVSLTASVSPSLPDAPVVSFRPSTMTVSAGGSVSYVTALSAAMTTPTGNYLVTVTARSGTITHSYNAILMVGDYRPQPEEPPTTNDTNTAPTNQPRNEAGNHLSPVAALFPVLNILMSLWWLQTIVAMGVFGIFLFYRRRLGRD